MVRELSDETLEELVAFADWRVQYYQATNILPDSYSAQDFVHSALVKVIEGERKYDSTRGEFIPWLKSQIRSLISNACDYHKRRPESRYSDGENSELVEDKMALRMAVDEVFSDSNASNPEDIVVAQEEEKEAEETVDALYKKVQGEPELEQIIDALWNGCDPKPRFLAEELNISVQEVRNRVNKLHRRLLKLREDA